MSGLKSLADVDEAQDTRSHPAWDEWIEIALVFRLSFSGCCLIPLGMSGLKFLRFFGYKFLLYVSSRLGWVDWNSPFRRRMSCWRMSHPAWDEWIEMILLPFWQWRKAVSSRLGWVDWNKVIFRFCNLVNASHPAWDEWIEIFKISYFVFDVASHPAWDEWIEI